MDPPITMMDEDDEDVRIEREEGRAITLGYMDAHPSPRVMEIEIREVEEGGKRIIIKRLM